MCKLIGRHVILKICVHSKFLFKYLLASLFSHSSSLEYTQKQKEEISLQTYKEFEQLEKEKKKKEKRPAAVLVDVQAKIKMFHIEQSGMNWVGLEERKEKSMGIWLW